jgi:hypothetical protein
VEGHVYHWKHGWIPLDHLAARIKAKGSTSGMHRYVSQYNIPDRRAGGERRTAERDAKKVTPTDRGGFNYRPGTRTKHYPQRGDAPKAYPKPSVPAAPSNAHHGTSMSDAEMSALLPEGHTVRTIDGGGIKVHVHDYQGKNIGLVSQSPTTGKYIAGGPGGKDLGFDHATQLDAHKAIVKEWEAGAFQRKAAERDAAKAKRESEKMARAGAVTWTKDTPASLDDGSFGGRAAAAKAKQVYRSGHHTVVIESAMTQAQTEGLLADTSHTLENAGSNAAHIPVTFRVPTGDKTFRTSKNGGIVGGYVHQGGTVVHVNPKVARGELERAFGHTTSGHFMPANREVAGRRWVLTHELGHVIDGQNQHTWERQNWGGFAGSETRGDVTELSHEHRANFGNYGRKNNAEAYAEAWAQWQHAGPGTNKAADAFAKRFGWAAPTKLAGGAPASGPEKFTGGIPKAGQTVHVGTHVRYHGPGTVVSVNEADSTAVVKLGDKTGLVAFDQLHPTKADALANVKAMFGSGSLADMGGNRVARRQKQ